MVWALSHRAGGAAGDRTAAFDALDRSTPVLQILIVVKPQRECRARASDNGETPRWQVGWLVKEPRRSIDRQGARWPSANVP